MKDQKLAGVIISYITTILQMIINIFFTPFLINTLGTSEYGLYQTISSFANNLIIVNFGIATIMSRNIVKLRINRDKVAIENLLSMGIIISVLISILMLVIGSGASLFIEPLYSNSLSDTDIIKARYMFIYLIINLVVIVWNNMFSGICVGYEQFIFTNSLKLFRQILRVIIMTGLLMIGKDSVAIVVADLVVTVILLIAEVIFCLKKLKVKIKLHYIDKTLIINIFTFSIASLLQAITNQVNLSLDRVILGVMTTTTIVSMYSIALIILNTFLSITKVIGSVYLPQATKLVIQKSDGEVLTDLVIKVGRIQNIIACGIFGGMIILGENFIELWVGKEFIEVWPVIIILILPVVFTSTTSSANIIADAMLKKLARSMILIVTAILNLVITIIAVNKIGYVGAAIGTSVSIILGEIILLNIYYYKEIKLNIIRMYKEIFCGILPAICITIIFTKIIFMIINNSIYGFILKSLIFIIIYGYCLLKFGINQSERDWLIRMFSILRKKFNIKKVEA